MVMARTSFAFSPNGRYAACLHGDEPGRWHVESWPLDPVDSPTMLSGATAHRPDAQVLAVDDGEVLLCQPAELAQTFGVHELALLRPGAPARKVTTPRCRGLRLLGCPRRGVLAIAISTRDDQSSTVWLIRERLEALELLATVPGMLSGGVWLNEDRLAVTQADRGRVRTAVINLVSGMVSPLWPDGEAWRLLLASPVSGLRIIADGANRLGWTRTNADDVHWPQTLQPVQPMMPLTTDPPGTQVAFRVDHGARSGIAVFDPEQDTLRDVPLPEGTVGGVASWASTGEGERQRAGGRGPTGEGERQRAGGRGPKDDDATPYDEEAGS